MKIVVESKGHSDSTTVSFNGEPQELLEFSLSFRKGGKGVKMQVCKLLDNGRKFFYTLFNEDLAMYDKTNPENLNKGEN